MKRTTAYIILQYERHLTTIVYICNKYNPLKNLFMKKATLFLTLISLLLVATSGLQAAGQIYDFSADGPVSYTHLSGVSLHHGYLSWQADHRAEPRLSLIHI